MYSLISRIERTAFLLNNQSKKREKMGKKDIQNEWLNNGDKMTDEVWDSLSRKRKKRYNKLIAVGYSAKEAFIISDYDYNDYITALNARMQSNYDNKTNLENAQREQEYARESMELQNQLNEQSAITANERNVENYNDSQSVEAKIKEYENAGLSIGLLSGSISGGGISASGTSQTGLSSAKISNQRSQGAPSKAMTTAESLALLNQSTNQASQNALNFAQARKANAEANSVEAKQPLEEKMLSIQNQIAEATNETAIEKARAEINNLISTADLNNAKKEEIDKLVDSQKQLLEKEFEVKQSQIEMNEQQKQVWERQLQMRQEELNIMSQRLNFDKMNATEQRKWAERQQQKLNDFEKTMQQAKFDHEFILEEKRMFRGQMQSIIKMLPGGDKIISILGW